MRVPAGVLVKLSFAVLAALAATAAGCRSSRPDDGATVPLAAAPAPPASTLLMPAGVAWQPLDPAIVDVDLGPRTIWLSIEGETPPTLERLKADVESQWGHPVGSVRGAHVLLVDAGGRIWLRPRRPAPGLSSNLLLGYDGKAWVEKLPPEYTPIKRNEPRAASWWGEGIYGEGGAFFFTVSDMAYRFDGERWREHALHPPGLYHADRFQPVIAPNGDVTLVGCDGGGGASSTQSRLEAAVASGVRPLTSPEIHRSRGIGCTCSAASL